MAQDRGISLVELVVALAVATVVVGTVLSLVASSGSAFAVETEVSDMQQRARAAATALTSDIAAAGTGSYAGRGEDLPDGPAPAVAPYRTGVDPPGTFRTDAISLSRTSKTGVPILVTYWLKSDAATSTYQLMSFDGNTASVPVVDHVVALQFEYFGEPQPPRMRRPPTDATGPWTTYGPTPPPVASGSFGPGENCVFVSDGTTLPAPRLAALGPPGGALVPLGSAPLTDGPWCPDDVSSSRWDADLLRIRKVAGTFRIEAALAALRGPAGALFAHAGTSRGGIRWAPDLTVRVEMAPRNLAIGR